MYIDRRLSSGQRRVRNAPRSIRVYRQAPQWRTKDSGVGRKRVKGKRRRLFVRREPECESSGVSRRTMRGERRGGFGKSVLWYLSLVKSALPSGSPSDAANQTVLLASWVKKPTMPLMARGLMPPLG